MELDAVRTGFAVYEESNQGTVGRSMNTGDLVRLTADGLVAAWYPDTDQDVVGIVISPPEHQRGWVTVEWPDGRDTHMLQDLDIVRKYFS